MIKIISTTIFSIALLFLVSSTTTYAQKTITPGKGFEAIEIGMKTDECIKILGAPTRSHSKKDEILLFATSGYNKNTSFTLSVNFDMVHVFENDNEFAIWKIYTKKKKVVHVNISSYIYPESTYNNIQILGGLKFHSNLSDVEKILGNDYLGYITESEDMDVIYLSKGIRVIINDDGEVRNIYFFKPYKGRKKKKLIKQLGDGNK